MKKLVLLAICLSVAINVLVGCGKKTEEKVTEKIVEKIIEKQAGGKADVDLSEGKMSIKTKDGEMNINAGKSAKLPDDFPKDIFVIKGAEVKMTMEMPQGKSVSFLIEKDMNSVIDIYKKEMKSKGWSEKMAMNMGKSASMIYQKDDRTTNIMIGTEKEKTMINVVIAKKELKK